MPTNANDSVPFAQRPPCELVIYLKLPLNPMEQTVKLESWQDRPLTPEEAERTRRITAMVLHLMD